VKILTIVGARPQFIKVCPLTRSINERQNVRQVLVHSGQHFDKEMSDSFFMQLGLSEPDYHLGINQLPRGAMVGRMTEALEEIIYKEQPDWVLVFGDTDSTLAGALAGSHAGFPVVHVEAGLRSYQRSMPEEINRVLTDHASTILFCPTIKAVQQLGKEGFQHVFQNGEIVQDGMLAKFKPLIVSVDKPLVINVGDIMYDCFRIMDKVTGNSDRLLSGLGVSSGQFALATVHRAENTNDVESLYEIMQGLNEICRTIPVCFPVHPRTRKTLVRQNWWPKFNSEKKIIFTEPLSYLDFINLEKHAKVIITDSGGIQKEAVFAGTPCITLRNNTEWPETVENGWNQLVGTDARAIVEAVLKLESMPLPKPLFYGEGNTSQLILDTLQSCLSS
jgi:UDP-GlcNAc3NAcA epimerase